MNLGPKMKEYLAAAAKVGRKRGEIFALDDVDHWVQWESAECERIAAALEKEGLLSRLPNGEAILTTAGMRLAESL
jgi:predicted transcriptional regulator of viral defense system